MIGLHVESMTRNKVDIFISTKIGQPVSGEYALTADNKTLTIRFDQP
jgi:hypothetical protein